ncbi:MAG: hypothetical protein WCJ45_03025 [bacterium]
MLACIACLLFFSTSVSAAISASNLGLQTEILPEQRNNNAFAIQILMKSYCNHILSGAFIEKTFVYTPKQSAFVYLLCRNITPTTVSSYFKDQESKIFKRLTFDQL